MCICYCISDVCSSDLLSWSAAGLGGRTAARTVSSGCIIAACGALVVMIANVGRFVLDHIGRPAFDGGALDGAFDQFLDGGKQLDLGSVDQRHGRPGAAGAARAADAMNIVFGDRKSTRLNSSN